MWDLGEYQKCGIWASTRKVGSGQVPEMWDLGEYQKCGILTSTRKVEIRASTGSGRNPGEMLENPKQAKEVNKLREKW